MLVLQTGIKMLFCVKVSPGLMYTESLYGEPEVLKFRDGKLGAYSMQFDDSRLSQANIMIPHVNWTECWGSCNNKN